MSFRPFPLLFLVLLVAEAFLFSFAPVQADPGTETKTYVIGASKDDAWSKVDDVKWDDVSYYLSRSDMRAGCRWSIDVPKGAVIEHAYYIYRAKGSSSGAAKCRIHVFNQDSCDDFDVAFWDWAVMLEAVNWTLPNLIENEWHTSLDLKEIIQAFIDRPGYVSGNYIGLRFLWQSGPEPGHEVWALDGSASSAAKLEVTYATEIPPIADYTYSPEDLIAGEAMTFNASSSYDPDGTIVAYDWDFDDGTNGTGLITKHTFMSAGTYNVTLTVVDNEGYDTSISDMITVAAVYSHDVAIVNVTSSATEANIGQEINITVTVKNNGSVDETFKVTLYYDDTQIGRQRVSNLNPGSNITLTFKWNTTGASPESYTIKAVADTVLGETDTRDNTLIDGAINVLTVYTHDVAVTNVLPSATEIIVGQVLNVSVVVRNKGNIAENFNVTLYYESSAIGTQIVADLEPGAETTLRFSWDTTDVTPDVSYTIEAVASGVAGETVTVDNRYTYDTSVRVKSQVTYEPFDWSPILPYLFPIFALGVLVFSVAGIAWKKREVGEGFEFFNEITGGGIPPACSVMIIGGVKSGKSILCQQLVQDYLSRGKACVYINYDSFPEAVRETMKSFHWDTSEHEEKGTFKLVDCYSSTTGIASQEKHQVGHPFYLSNLNIAVSTAMKEVKRKPPRVFLDSTTPLFASLTPLQVTRFLQDYSAEIKRGKGVFFFTIKRGSVRSRRRLEEMVDYIIELDVYEGKEKTLKRMRVRKRRGRKVTDAWIPFKIEPKKGITFFPPKGWSESREN